MNNALMNEFWYVQSQFYQVLPKKKDLLLKISYWKFDQNVASLAVARGVLLQLFTKATKVVKEIDQIIASLYM